MDMKDISIISFKNGSSTIRSDRLDQHIKYGEQLGYSYQCIESHDTLTKKCVEIKESLLQNKDTYKYFILDLSENQENTFFTCTASNLCESVAKMNVRVKIGIVIDNYKILPPVVYDAINFNKKYQQGRSVFDSTTCISSNLMIGTCEGLISFIDLLLNISSLDTDGIDRVLNSDSHLVKRYLISNEMLDMDNRIFSIIDTSMLVNNITNEDNLIGYIRPYTIAHFTSRVPDLLKRYDPTYITNTSNNVYGINYINLRSRPDRREKIENVFKKLNISDTAKIFLADRHPKGGMYGCFDSHFQVLDRSEEDIIIVFEDDCTLDVDTDQDAFQKVIDYIKFYFTLGYDFFSFGCVPIPGRCHTLHSYQNISHDQKIMQLTAGNFITALAYAIKKSAFESLKQSMKDNIGRIHYDSFYMMKNVRCIGLSEPIVYQDFSDSDNGWLPDRLQVCTFAESYIRDTLSKACRYNAKNNDLTCVDVINVRYVSFLLYMYTVMYSTKIC